LRPIPAGREKLSRDVMEEHQRARVVEAAIDVFAEKGYPGTTVDDLVNAARVGVGSFYALFGGKEECLVAAYETVTKEARAETIAAAGSTRAWGAQVAIGLKALLKWVQREPVKARIALIEIQSAGPSALHSYEETLDAVAGFLAKGREVADLPRPLPETLEQTTVNGIAWLLHRRLSTGEAASLDSLLEELALLILVPYLGEEGAEREIAAGAVVLTV
jgi:AcrR family transcriptional regulator